MQLEEREKEERVDKEKELTKKEHIKNNFAIFRANMIILETLSFYRKHMI